MGTYSKKWAKEMTDTLVQWRNAPTGNAKADLALGDEWGLDVNVNIGLANGDDSCDSAPGSYCLAKTLAHEALHFGGHSGGPDRFVPSPFTGKEKMLPWSQWEGHGTIRDIVDECVSCPD